MIKEKTLEIKKYPDRILRKKCAAIEEVTHDERDLWDTMYYTMKFYHSIGLAAPQVGISKRLIVADIGEGIIKLANPEVVEVKGGHTMTEQCLSISDVEVDVERPSEVVVKGLSEKGELIEIKAERLLARVLQHEIDHLRGKLIIDYLSMMEKLKFKLKKEKFLRLFKEK